jgi:hypothetical protein
MPSTRELKVATGGYWSWQGRKGPRKALYTTTRSAASGLRSVSWSVSRLSES